MVAEVKARGRMGHAAIGPDAKAQAAALGTAVARRIPAKRLRRQRRLARLRPGPHDVARPHKLDADVEGRWRGERVAHPRLPLGIEEGLVRVHGRVGELEARRRLARRGLARRRWGGLLAYT